MVTEMVFRWESTDHEDSRGFRRASLLDPTTPPCLTQSKAKPFELDDECLLLLHSLISKDLPTHLLLPRGALSTDHISIKGVSFSSSKSTRPLDSAIVFRGDCVDHEQPSSADLSRAGIIELIFQYTHGPMLGTNYYHLV